MTPHQGWLTPAKEHMVVTGAHVPDASMCVTRWLPSFIYDRQSCIKWLYTCEIYKQLPVLKWVLPFAAELLLNESADAVNRHADHRETWVNA